MDQGAVLPGLRSRHRRRRTDPRSACSRRRRTTAGCRRRAPTTARGSRSDASGSSIRSTAPAPISAAARTGRSARRWSRTASRCSPRCSRRRPTSSSSPAMAAVPTRNDVAIQRLVRRQLRHRSHGRAALPPQPGSRNVVAGTEELQDRIARAAHQPRRAGRARCGLRRRQQPRLGPCRRRPVAARGGRPADLAQRR